MRRRKFDYSQAWQMFLDGQNNAEIGDYFGVHRTYIRGVFVRNWPEEYTRIAASRSPRLATNVVMKAWEIYQSQDATVREIASTLDVNHKTLRRHMEEIAGYKELARHRAKLQGQRLGGSGVGQTTKARRSAGNSIKQKWDDDSNQNAKSSLKSRWGEHLRFRNEISSKEGDQIILEFKNYTPMMTIARSHNLGYGVVITFLQERFSPEEYRAIVFEIHRLVNLARRRKTVLTENHGKKRGQPGNKRSQSLGSRNINHSMPVTK